MNKYYNNALTSNYGVKERNVICIFHPLGISIETLRNTRFFASIHEYGNVRGDVAHESLSVSKYLSVKGNKMIDFNNCRDILREIIETIQKIVVHNKELLIVT